MLVRHAHCRKLNEWSDNFAKVGTDLHIKTTGYKTYKGGDMGHRPLGSVEIDGLHVPPSKAWTIS